MVTFVRVATSRLFVPEGHAADPRRSRTGFLPAATPAQDRITLADSWGRGFYAVWPELDTEPDWESFGERLWRAFDERAPQPRLGWFDATASPVGTSWFTVDDGDRLTSPVSLRLQSSTYTVTVARECRVRAGEDALIFDPGGPVHRFELFDREGTLRSIVIRGPLTLSLDGGAAGGFGFEIPLREKQLSYLGAGLRYSRLHKRTGPGSGTVFRGTDWPLFRLGDDERLLCRASVDVLAPEDPERTHFLVLPGTREDGAGAAPSDGSIPTYFETAHGHPVSLRPAAGARLVLANDPQRADAAGNPEAVRHAMVPDGGFELCVAGDGGGDHWPEEHELVTGTSTSESVLFRPRRGEQPGDRIVFHPGRPALDRRSLPPGAVGAAAPTGAARYLDGRTTTAWVSFERAGAGAAPEALYLSSQPEELTLYADAGTGAAAAPRNLDFDPQKVAASRPFPMVPFLGLLSRANDVGEALLREADVLSPARREELRDAASPAAEGGAAAERRKRLTPQGFPVDLTGNAWQKLTFANSRHGDFGLGSLGPRFEVAVKRNRTFLVVTRLGEGLARLTNDVEIGGWTFKLPIPEDGAAPEDPTRAFGFPPPTMILKYHDVPLSQLVQDTESWTEKEAFNANVGDVQKRLQDYIETARRRHEELERARRGSSPYRGFLRRVDDANWNGVLVLNAALPLLGLPEQVQGIAVGIDEKRFRVHHFGVELNQVGQEGFDIRKSSLFGLIDYPSPPVTKTVDEMRQEAEENDGFAFNVKKLQVLFENSEVQRFDCTVQLWLGSLFEEKAQQVDPTSGAGVGHEIIEFDGNYESRRAADGSKIETYSFIHTQEHVFEIDSFILEKIVLRRLQLTTTKGAGEDSGKVTTRFAFWGDIVFRELELDVFSFKRLSFDDLGLLMDFELPENVLSGFKLDLGPLRFDIEESEKRGGSFLDKLPLKFKFFQFAPPDLNLNLPDLGYFAFGNSKASDFRFALGFDLDLGTLGALAKKLERFVGKVLIAWKPGSGDFALGFKLSGNGGGRLDIGIENVLKLIVKHFKIEEIADQPQPGDKTYAIQLVDCKLEVLGKAVPEDASLNVFLFADPQAFEKIGWFGSLKDAEIAGGLKLPFVGLGQRVDAFPSAGGGRVTTGRLLDHMIGEIGEVDETGKLVSLLQGDRLRYDPSRDWTVALRALLWSFADLDVAFLDPDLYGLRLRVPATGNPRLFELDILYRKITDELGVYALEFALPDAWRQIELGAVSITIPVVGLEIYTNGDYLIDVGYPWELDFSRSFAVQVLPFLGNGGFYWGQLSGVAVRQVPRPVNRRYEYDPVLRMGIALRVGIGKEFRKGILKAGLVVSVFGTLEGIWARLHDRGAAHGPATLVPPKDYFVIRGTSGILGEIYGQVDFGIVKAGVSIRVWVSNGWVLETWRPVVVFIEAGVSVRVRVVIGRIKIFGKKIEIKITLRFSTRLRFEWKLLKGKENEYRRVFGQGVGIAALPAAAEEEEALGAPRPLDWRAGYRHFEEAPPELKLYFVPDATLGAPGDPHCVALLAIEGGPDAARGSFDELVQALAAWTLWSRFSTERPGKPLSWTISRDDLRHLDACLQIPTSLGRPSSAAGHAAFDPLDDVKIAAFLGENFEVRIVSPAEGDELGAVFFPMLPDLRLRLTDGGDTVHDVDYRRTPLFSESYQKHLVRHFERLRVLLETRDTEGLGAVEREATLAALLFEDYFHFLVKATVDAMWDTLVDADVESLSLGDLFAAMAGDGDADRFARLAGMAGRFFLHGLSLPESAQEDAAQLPMYRLAQLQVPFFPAGLPQSHGSVYEARLLVSTEVAEPWFEVSSGPDAPVERLDFAALTAMSATPVSPLLLGEAEIVPPIRRRPRVFSFQDPSPWQTAAGEAGTLWPLAADLREAARVTGHLTVSLRRRTGGKAFDVRGGEKLDRRWATLIPLTVRRAMREGAERAVPFVYVLGGVTEDNRRHLDLLLKEHRGLLENAQVHLLTAAPEAGELSEAAVDAGDVFLVKTNLSTEPTPVQTPGFAAEEPEMLISAGLDDPVNFLALVRQCSIVNTGGYFLHYHTAAGTGLPDHVFPQDNDEGRLELVLVYGESGDTVEPFYNAVLVPPDQDLGDALDGAGEEIPATRDYLEGVSNLSDVDVVRAPGTAAFRLYRQAPERRYHTPSVLGDAEPRQDLTREEVMAELTAAGVVDPEAVAAALAEAGEGAVELESRFNLLGYAVGGEGFGSLDASATLPIGPQSAREEPVPGSDPAADEDPLPPGVQPEDWRYEHALPLYKLASSNAGLGGEERSPYAGMGGTAELTLDLRDVYGNPLAGWSRQLPVPLRYFDRLLPVTDWPAVVASFGTDPSRPGEIGVELRFDAQPFLALDPAPDDEEGQRARGTLAETRALYQKVAAQLEDGNTRVSLSTTLAAEGSEAEVDSGELRAFVQGVLTFLDALPGGADPQLSWSASLPVAALRDEDFVELKLRMHWRRRRELVYDDSFLDAWDVQVELPPAIPSGAAEDAASGSQRFAASFESCFPSRKLATGVGAGSNRSLWVVRRGLIDLSVDRSRGGGRASFFAPPPLSTELLSGKVPVHDFDAGADAFVPRRVTDVDLDVLARGAWQDIERFLAPETVTAARKVSPEVVDRIVRHKQDLAEGLSAELTLVLKDPGLSPGASRRKEAVAVLRDRLRIDLEQGTSVDSVVLLPIGPAGSADPGKAPEVFGRVVTSTPDPNVVLSSAKVELHNDEPVLIFLVDSIREEERGAVRYEDLAFRLTHVERRVDRQSLAYRDTAWLQLVLPIEVPLASAQRPVTVPIPVRRYPVPPALVEHGGEVAETLGDGTWAEKVGKAREWSYRFDFDRLDVAQDTVYASVRYNVSEEAVGFGVAEDVRTRRLHALVNLQEHREGLWKVLGALAGDAVADREEVLRTLQRFDVLLRELAQSFAPGGFSFAAEGEKLEDLFKVRDLPVDGGRRTIEVCRVAGGVAKDFTIAPLGRRGEAVEARPEASGDPSCRRYSYEPPPEEAAAEARRWLRRRLSVLDLDVLAVENGWAGVELTRNEELIPGQPSQDAFVYRTAPTRFGEQWTPFHDVHEVVVVDSGGQRPLRRLIADFLRVLSAGAGDSATLEMEIRWGYESGLLEQALGDAAGWRAPRPIYFMPAFPLGLGEGGTGFDVSSVAEAGARRLKSWAARNLSAGMHGDAVRGHFVADIRVYARLSLQRKPILRLRQVRFPLSAVEDPFTP